MVTIIKAKEGLILDPFRTIQRIHWGGAPWLEISATVTPGGTLQTINAEAHFPFLLGSPPTLTMITGQVPTDAPSQLDPVEADELAATLGGRFTGFRRAIVFNPPPTPPGGAAFAYIKIDRNSDDFLASDPFRVRLNVSGIESATVRLQVATYQNIKTDDVIPDLDFAGIAFDERALPAEDPPLSYEVDFDVDTTTLDVTQV